MSQTAVQTINGRYEIDRSDESAFLGQGGMGSVYRATDTTTGETVAVKSLKPELIERDKALLQRFRQEGEALRQLNHPNIVKIIDMVEQDDVHYLVMEYVAGGSLRQVLRREGEFSVQRALYIALDVADALTRAHRLNILHRDIKPDNVLLADDGTPRLTDFGMARFNNESHLTQDGAIVGTMAYLAPEVFQGEQPDERTDIWAFGVMLYEMLAGERPFAQEMPAALINAIMTQTVPDLEDIRDDAPISLVDLVYRMVTKDRQARIPSVRLVGAELEAIIRGSEEIQAVLSPETTGRFEGLSTTPQPRVTASRIQAPNNLPNQPTAFVGRTDDLNALQHLLESGSSLITLLGPGGMGKTRLGLACAERQLSHYPDGVYFVPLAPIDDPAHIVPTIAEEIDFSFGSADARADLLNYLREKHMLLVLDNFEHLTAGADIVSDMLQAAPDVQILVTSRERLRLRGEQIYEVRGMHLPESVDVTATEMNEFPAVQLFVQSAKRVQPDFDIDDDTTGQQVAEIIGQVDGLPLGIELAAAWLEMLPLDEIVREIENSLDFLETDLRDVPERHRSIRAVFEYSWNMLDEAERETFLQLSVFRGGFEREAAQQVAGASLRGLTTLVNKSLLQRTPEGRYSVHKLLRQYAEERFLTHEARPNTVQAHSEYYVRFLEKLRPVLNTHREKRALDAIDVELDNVRLAWRNCVESEDWDNLSAVLDTILWFYLGHSMLQEGYTRFQSLAQTMQDAGDGDHRLYWRTLTRQAWVGSRLGRYDEVIELANRAAEHFKQHIDERVERAYAYNQLSYAFMMTGDYEKSKLYAQQAVGQIEDKRDDVIAWYMGMGNLGYACYLQGDFTMARDIYETINRSAQEVEYSASGQAYGKNNLGEILRQIGDTQRAQTLFKEAYAIFENIKHRRGMAFTLNNIAGIRFMQGDYPQARERYERAYQLHKDIGDRSGEAHSLSAMGNAAISIGETDEAKKHFRESLALRREMGDKRGIADSLADLARVAVNEGDVTTAQENISEAIRIRREIGDRQGEGQALAGRGIAMILLDNHEAARDDIEAALAIGNELGSVFIIAQAYAGKGELAYHDGDYDTADYFYRETLRTSEGTESLSFALYALVGLARLEIQRDNNKRALELVSLVLRYPSDYIGMIENQARDLLGILTERVGKKMVEETLVQSKSLALQQVVADLIAEDTS